MTIRYQTSFSPMTLVAFEIWGYSSFCFFIIFPLRFFTFSDLILLVSNELEIIRHKSCFDLNRINKGKVISGGLVSKQVD